MFPNLSNKLLLVFVVLSVILFSCQKNADLESWLAGHYKNNIPEGENWVIVAEGCGSCIETYSSFLRDRLERDDIHFIVSGTSGLREMYLNCGLVPYRNYKNVLFDSSGYLLEKEYILGFGARLKVDKNGKIINKTMIEVSNFHAMMDTLLMH